MQKKTLEQLGIHKGFYYARGNKNSITDVDGVLVGHSTLIEGVDIRTGVTVILPPVDFSENSLIAGGFVFNANGETTGLQYIFEESHLISPIFLTNTLSVGDVFSAVIEYYKGKVVLPIVGECWDGYLNDIEGRHVKKEHVYQAIESSSIGQVAQGNVGAGTGMTSFGFKGGIGTSSRKLTIDGKEYSVGVLVNNNLGNEKGSHRYLRIGNLDVAQIIGEYYGSEKSLPNPSVQQSSTIVVLATDIPLDNRQLNRISRHVVLGMGRVGIVSYSGSGDFIIAYSTANKIPKRGSGKNWKIEVIEESLLNDVFEATIEAVEEAFINSLLMAEDMVGRKGFTARALPIDEILSRVKV